MSKPKYLTYILKVIALFFCLIIVGISAGISNSTTFAYAENESVDVYEKIDNYFADTIKKARFPAASITIVNKENVLLTKTYGSCESTDTPFLLGSVSKSFTALCIMQLVEQGKIDLDDFLSEYLTENDVNKSITIRQLLNHTSGLGEHQNLTNYKIVGKQGVHVYANVNYSLLGKVIEKVSGKSYADYVAENVFLPLNMTNSFTSVETAKENGLIQGYENWFGINTVAKPKYSNSEAAWITTAAGYLSSSTADLGKYLQMYLNGGNNVISTASIDKMFYDNVSVEASIPYKYGMGWTLTNEPLKQPALRHSGLVETGMSVVYILPESEIGVAFAVNTNDYFVGKDMMDRIDWSIALMLMGDEPNQIGANEYTLRHLLYDFAYFAIFVISVLPVCLISVYNKRLSKGKLLVKIVLLSLLHLLLPIFILLLPQIFFATPLWVVQAFVPDMFTTIIISACLLFIGGMIKGALLVKSKLNKSI